MWSIRVKIFRTRFREGIRTLPLTGCPQQLGRQPAEQVAHQLHVGDRDSFARSVDQRPGLGQVHGLLQSLHGLVQQHQLLKGDAPVAEAASAEADKGSHFGNNSGFKWLDRFDVYSNWDHASAASG